MRSLLGLAGELTICISKLLPFVVEGEARDNGEDMNGAADDAERVGMAKICSPST